MAHASVIDWSGLVLLAADGGEQGGLGGLLMPILIVVAIFYFLVFRPASKERKQREAQINNIEKHDKVITNAGIHGTVMSLDDDTVVLRVDDKNNVRMKFSRQSIWQVESPAGKSSGSSSSGGKDKDVRKAEAKA